jgi:NAD(P)-dependent dehydrogenase (short-subunit alcohol dehydrogenase family)
MVDRIAVVTGASLGIGRAPVVALAEEGFQVTSPPPGRSTPRHWANAWWVGASRCSSATRSWPRRPTCSTSGPALGVPGRRLDAAEELYRRHGAGAFWLERVAADRRA